MKEIILTQGQIALVDDEDFERVSQYKWHAVWKLATRSYYATRTIPNKKELSIARFIINCKDINKIIDHRNHNTLDNQRHNLRICTYSENSQNCMKQHDCTSIYKGVYWRKDQSKWAAQINPRNIFDQIFHLGLGCFESEKEAAKAYDEAAKEEFGEFANLNFPEEKRLR